MRREINLLGQPLVMKIQQHKICTSVEKDIFYFSLGKKSFFLIGLFLNINFWLFGKLSHAYLFLSVDMRILQFSNNYKRERKYRWEKKRKKLFFDFFLAHTVDCYIRGGIACKITKIVVISETFDTPIHNWKSCTTRLSCFMQWSYLH